MSDMVERVARAIYEKRNGRGCKPWGNQPTAHKEPYLSDARAAIDAMRPATEAMKVAGCKHDDPLGELVDWRGADTTTREAVSGVFTAMIDAALSEGKP